MSKLSAIENPNQPLVGVNYTTFVNGVPEGNQLHSELLEKLFKDADHRKQGILDWASFLQTMIVLKPRSLASRVDSCLNLILRKEKESETDYDMAFTSFEEVRMMCYLGLT